MLSSILANYGIYDITDCQIQGNKVVLMCNSIHNTNYKIEFIRKNNNEIRGLITDNESKKMLAFTYKDETSGENNLVHISIQEIANPNFNINKIAPENMTKHIRYVINKEFYGDDVLRIDGNPAIPNGKGFSEENKREIEYRFGLIPRIQDRKLGRHYDKKEAVKFLFDNNGELKEPGSCTFHNMFNTEETGKSYHCGY